jgi:peroxiredoxin Q/BCP
MQKIAPLQKNDPVPEFTTYDSEENKFSNKNLLGQTYLIYFYPRDNTPGCSAQACGFRDHYSFFKNNEIKILGVSGDSPRSHKNFIKKHQLPFPLLLDENHQIARAFGVWGEKKFMGRVFEGIHRISFLIDKLGKVKKTYLKVKAKQHPEDLVNELKAGIVIG